MLQELKSRSLKKMLPLAIILIIAGAALLAIWGKSALKVFTGATPLEEVKEKNLEGAYVSYDYNYCEGTFAVEETTTKRNGVTTGKHKSAYNNVIYDCDMEYAAETGDYKYMGICFPAKYKKDLDIVDNNSMSFWESESLEEALGKLTKTVAVKGTVKKMEKDMLRYYKEFFTEYYEYTDEEFDEYCLPYYIAVDSPTPAAMALAMILAVVLIGSGVWAIVWAVTGGGQKKVVKQLNMRGASEVDRAESDYANARELVKNVKVGRSYLFDINAATTKIIPYDSMMWAYLTETKHKTNGITTGTTFSLAIFDENRKQHTVNMPNKAGCIEALEYLSTVSPAVIGFTQELKVMYNKNFGEFMKIHNDRKAQMNGQAFENNQGFNQ